MAKTTHEIVGGGILAMLNSRADLRQAQLDLERATAAEQYAARTTVPGVLAQLKANADKEAAQRAKIAKQSEEQGPPPQAMVPPLTEVSGQANPRSAQGALKAAGDIANTVLGGRGVKTGQVGPSQPSSGLPGATGGINPSAQGPTGGGTQVAGPGVPTGSGTPPPGTPAAQVPAGIVVPPGPPGSVQQAYQPLEWWQRVLRGGAGVIGGVAGRNPGAVVQGVEQAVTGQLDYGPVVLPTEAEIAKDEAPVLSELLSDAKAKAGKDGEAEAVRKVKDHLTSLNNKYGSGPTEVILGTAQAGVIKHERELAETEAKSRFTSQMIERRTIEAEKRREAVKNADPNERLNDEMAQIIMDIRSGKQEQKSPEQQRRDQLALDTWKSVSPLNQIYGQVMGAAKGGLGGATPPGGPGRVSLPEANDEQVNGVINGLFSKLGRDPTPGEIAAELANRGLR